MMAARRDFWQQLYGKQPVDLPRFHSVLGRHMPHVPEGAWARVKQYSMRDLQFALDRADRKTPGPNHLEARFNKALPALVQWLLVHCYWAILRSALPLTHGRAADSWLSPKVPHSKLDHS